MDDMIKKPISDKKRTKKNKEMDQLYTQKGRKNNPTNRRLSSKKRIVLKDSNRSFRDN